MYGIAMSKEMFDERVDVTEFKKMEAKLEAKRKDIEAIIANTRQLAHFFEHAQLCFGNVEVINKSIQLDQQNSLILILVHCCHGPAIGAE